MRSRGLGMLVLCSIMALLVMLAVPRPAAARAPQGVELALLSAPSALAPIAAPVAVVERQAPDSGTIRVASSVSFAAIWARIAALIAAILVSALMYLVNKVIAWKWFADLSGGTKTVIYLLLGGLAATLFPGLPADASHWTAQTAQGFGSAIVTWLGFNLGHASGTS